MNHCTYTIKRPSINHNLESKFLMLTIQTFYITVCTYTVGNDQYINISAHYWILIVFLISLFTRVAFEPIKTVSLTSLYQIKDDKILLENLWKRQNSELLAIYLYRSVSDNSWVPRQIKGNSPSWPQLISALPTIYFTKFVLQCLQQHVSVPHSDLHKATPRLS